MSSASLHHDALFYSSDDEYVSAIRDFAGDGLAAGRPVLVAVPGRKLVLLRSALADLDGGVHFADMERTGGNPARIIPFVQGFVDAHSDGPVRFVGEPIWADRTGPEIVEAVRHEGLINEAFAHAAAHIACPYDLRDLDDGVLADARRTHRRVLCGDGERRPSADYVDPLVTYAAAERPLPEPRVVPIRVSVSNGLPGFRSAVEEQARLAGLSPDRVASFVLAANEAAANTVAHAGGEGSARIWRDQHELVCEVSDTGVIADPLVGRRTPAPDQPGGRGIWLMNQLSDLVELRSDDRGTVVRIHMRLN